MGKYLKTYIRPLFEYCMVTPFETRYSVNQTSSTPLHKAATWVVKLHIYDERFLMLNLVNLQTFDPPYTIQSHYVLQYYINWSCLH